MITASKWLTLWRAMKKETLLKTILKSKLRSLKTITISARNKIPKSYFAKLRRSQNLNQVSTRIVMIITHLVPVARCHLEAQVILQPHHPNLASQHHQSQCPQLLHLPCHQIHHWDHRQYFSNLISVRCRATRSSSLWPCKGHCHFQLRTFLNQVLVRGCFCTEWPRPRQWWPNNNNNNNRTKDHRIISTFSKVQKQESNLNLPYLQVHYSITTITISAAQWICHPSKRRTKCWKIPRRRRSVTTTRAPQTVTSLPAWSVDPTVSFGQLGSFALVTQTDRQVVRKVLDPLGQPTMTASSNHCFHTCRPSVNA